MSARILVVDDDSLMLATVCRMLEAEGIVAIGLEDVSQLDAALAEDGPFHVIVLDIWHRGRPAFDILERLRSARPGQKVLVISGGGGTISLEASMALAEINRPDALLTKPFTRRDLMDELGPLLPASP